MLDIFLVIVAALTAVIYFVRSKRLPTEAEKLVIKKVFFSFVLEAEKRWGGKTGEAKLAYVVQAYNERAPELVKRFVKPENLIAAIEAAVTRMKEYFLRNPSAMERIVGSDRDGNE